MTNHLYLYLHSRYFGDLRRWGIAPGTHTRPHKAHVNQQPGERWVELLPNGRKER